MFYPMYFDPFMPLIFLALGFAMWAQWKVKSNFEKYSQVSANSGDSAAEVARKILDGYGLQSVPVERVSGELTDHYDPKNRVLALSSPVHDSRSIAAYGIAAHEAGHALQHAKGFIPLVWRNAIYPVASVGSNMAVPLFIMGLLFSFPALMDVGILMFAGAVLFSLITLPVEFDASSRAMSILRGEGILDAEELVGARHVLSAAALTYLASTLMAVLQLLRLFFLRGQRN